MSNGVKYYYAKDCRACDSRYYKKEISQQQFNNLEENPSLGMECNDDEYIAVIGSCCDSCTEEYYRQRGPEDVPY